MRKKLCRFVQVNRSVSYSVYRRSVDARRKDDIRFVYTILAESAEGFKADPERISKEGFRIDDTVDLNFEVGTNKSSYRPIVVGCGPAGMFAALVLAEQGYKPILIERGECLTKRISSVESFFNTGLLNTESNVMFGAGGAGTFSDGKLVTRINDPLGRYVINRLLDFGAPSEIAYMAKPHIGTDLLQGVVSNLLNRVLNCGGDIYYNCLLNSIVENDDGSVTAKTSLGDFCGSSIILAIGHSARDTYTYLNNNGYSMIAKPFSVGIRIEHLREDIERGLYGNHAGDPLLGAAEYALSDTKNGRGVYTFCMCPGGEVIAASSEEGGLVVNGMSRHARNGQNSNSAVAVSIRPDDYDGTPMGAVEYQRNLERKAFALGSGNFAAPIELLGDFLRGKSSSLKSPDRIYPTYTRGCFKVADISEIFPSYVNEELRYGFKSFSKKLPGFDAPDAVMTAVESRTSAPIRILRDECGIALGKNSVYPCGEGAGYAGGIVSAAVDGLRVAAKIIEKYAPIEK
jgi:uncharacterized FAD-dependent dehydrogenase